MIRPTLRAQAPSPVLRKALAHAFMGTTLCLGQPAVAAEVAVAQDDDRLIEVIVVMERRNEDVQKMAVSIVALTPDDLQEKGIQSVADLQSQVPSLTFTNGGLAKFINIRGVGLNEAAPYQTVGVANYLDGAYIARETTTDDSYFDLAGVQVLRGPQGTYVGQNSTGGAIFVQSRAPSLEKAEGYAQIKAGNYKYRSVEGAVGVPLSDTLAVRASVLSESSDSFTTNDGPFGPGTVPVVTTHPGDLSHLVGRMQVLYAPTENFSARLIYQNSSRRTDGTPWQVGETQPFDQPYRVSYDLQTIYDVDYERATVIADWQFVPTINLHAVSSYQDTRIAIREDQDGTSGHVAPAVIQRGTNFQLHDWYYTNEIDLVSSLSGPFQWTAGVAQLEYNQPFTLQIFDYNHPPGGLGSSAGLQPDPNNALLLGWRTFRKNLGAFGEISYDFASKWQVKIGARYNRDEASLLRGSFVTFSGNPSAPHAMLPENVVESSAVTGRVLLNYQPNDNHFLYITASKGYKPGAWVPPAGRVEKETVVNYELGWKADLYDQHLRLAADIFYMPYEGFQATYAEDVLDPSRSVTKNVDGTKIKGAEFELRIAYSGFEFDLSGTYLDAKYGRLDVVAQPGTYFAGSPATPRNIEGQQIDYAPEFSGSTSLSYRVGLNSGSSLTPRLQWVYTGQQWTNFLQAEQHDLPSSSHGSFRLGYDSGAAWKADIYVTNLTDRLNMANRSGNSPAMGRVLWGAPRQYGVLLNYTF
jgi:iron complex outermembrane receptor protein